MTSLHDRSGPIAIVGAGLSGLYAAYRLYQQGRRFDLFEASDRLGGRILSTGDNGLDLGPTWFWPDHQRRMAALLTELDIPVVPQADRSPTVMEDEDGRLRHHYGAIYGGGTYRIAGGWGHLIHELVKRIPADTIHRNAEVTSIRQEPNGVTLELSRNKHTPPRYAQVWLAMPPRLIARLSFSPTLPSTATTLLMGVPTWMAGQAKYVARYSRRVWQDKDLAGTAFSQLGPLREIHDISDVTSGALFGFFGLPYSERNTMGKEQLMSHCRAQLARLLGQEAGAPEQEWLQDWSGERLTAVEQDWTSLPAHPVMPRHGVISPEWCSRLQLLGSEAARDQAGYLEGALISAEAALIKVES